MAERAARPKRASRPLQRLFDASVNTLHNCAQETLVDGMARERQQYSGDGGHQMHAMHLAFGETRLPARYLTTFSQGLTKDGYFLDCWPAYDRLARLIERQLDLTGWGPILDHGVGFNFDCWHHYLYTGDLDALREPYPRLLRFAQYLQGLVGARRLAAGRGPGHSVGLDGSRRLPAPAPQAMRLQPLSAAAMQHALAPICRAFGDAGQAEAVEQFGRELLQPPRSAASGAASAALFVNNLPWLAEEKTRAHLRPFAGDGHPLRPMPWRPDRDRGAFPGGVPAGDGLFVSLPTPAGASGRWPGRPGGRDRQGSPRALGHRWTRCRLEQHPAGGLEGRPGPRRSNGATARSCRSTSPTTVCWG